MLPIRRKPFPARVNWLALWRCRWVVLDLLNQIAHGEPHEAVQLIGRYSGSPVFGFALYDAARKIIDVRRPRR